MDRALVRRWAAGHAAAGQRVLDALRDEGPAPPDIAFAEALDLLVLAFEKEDPFREQEVALARAAWAKLRACAASRDRQ